MIVDAIGWKAHAALTRSGGQARVMARTSASTWIVADGDILWLGAREVVHPRAIRASGDDGEGDTVRLDVGATLPWRPSTPPATASARRRATDAARRQRGALDAIGAPDGLARLLGDDASRSSDDVLARAAGPAAALERACATDSPSEAVMPAVTLLGLGAGLTPSGDDFVGGVFFARRWLGTEHRGWRAAADAIRAAARDRTHPISGALLDDLLVGDTYGPLHDVLAALVAGVDVADTARRLTRLGHSSGWDMLAGLLVGLAPR